MPDPVYTDPGQADLLISGWSTQFASGPNGCGPQNQAVVCGFAGWTVPGTKCP